VESTNERKPNKGSAEKEWGIEMKKFLNKLEKVTGFDIDGDGKVCTRLCFSRLHFLVWFLRCC